MFIAAVDTYDVLLRLPYVTFLRLKPVKNIRTSSVTVWFLKACSEGKKFERLVYFFFNLSLEKLFLNWYTVFVFLVGFLEAWNT